MTGSGGRLRTGGTTSGAQYGALLLLITTYLSPRQALVPYRPPHRIHAVLNTDYSKTAFEVEAGKHFNPAVMLE